MDEAPERFQKSEFQLQIQEVLLVNPETCKAEYQFCTLFRNGDKETSSSSFCRQHSQTFQQTESSTSPCKLIHQDQVRFIPGTRGWSDTQKSMQKERQKAMQSREQTEKRIRQNPAPTPSSWPGPTRQVFKGLLLSHSLASLQQVCLCSSPGPVSEIEHSTAIGARLLRVNCQLSHYQVWPVFPSEKCGIIIKGSPPPGHSEDQGRSCTGIEPRTELGSESEPCECSL